MSRSSSMKISSVTSVTPKSIVFVGVPRKKLKDLRHLTEWGLPWQVVADTSTKVILFAINDDSGVPYAVHLLANHLARELSSHAVREIVDV